MSSDKNDFAHLESGVEDKRQPNVPHLSETLRSMPMAPTPEQVAQSVEVTEAGKSMPYGQAFKIEIWAVLFSLVFILPAIGQGFDSGAGSISVNMPAFLIKFGAFDPELKKLYVPSLWLGLWNAFSSVGNAVGSLITGALTDRFGYRMTQLMACGFSIATVFLQVFAINREMILMGKLLNGISMGIFVASSAGYISEVTGPRVRATLMSALAASPIIGIVAAVGIGSNAAVIGNLADWGSWKLILGLQWALPTMAIPLLLFTPDSPTDWVKRGKPEVALKAIRRIRPKQTEAECLVTLAGVQLAVATSVDEAKSQSNSYAECFKGVDLKRTLTVMIMFCGTQFSGVPLLSNGLYFLAQTGMPFTTVADVSLAFLGVAAIVCVSASFLLDRLGRRNLLVYGCMFHIALMTIVGCLHYATSQAGVLAMAMLFNIAISTAQLSAGAPVYSLAVEITSVRLRSKTQSLGFCTYYVMGWIFLFTVPYMFQAPPEGAGWGVRASWFFAGLTVLFTIFAYFFVPETKGRSYADIDELYHRGISPRKFASVEVHAERDAVA